MNLKQSLRGFNERLLEINKMTNEKIELSYETWFERLKRLEEAGIKTIPAQNGFDIISPVQPQKSRYEIKINK